MRVLVTGGAGYLGAPLCEYLSHRGHYVVSVDLKPQVEFETPSINVIDDFDNLNSVWIRSFWTVVHLAAMTSVSQCEENLSVTLKENTEKTCTLISKLSTDQHFIYASSSAVYGDARGKRVSWNKVNRRSNYSLSKGVAEHFVPRNGTILRIATLWGFSPSMRDGILVHDAIKTMRQENKAIVLDPETRRPYMNVRDCVIAITQIIEKRRTGKINMGTETLLKRDIIEKFAQQFGLPVIEGTNNRFRQDFIMPTYYRGKRLLENYKEALWASAYFSRHSGEKIEQPNVSTAYWKG